MSLYFQYSTAPHPVKVGVERNPPARSGVREHAMPSVNIRRKPERRPPWRCLTLVTRLELGGAQQMALQTLAALPRKKYQGYLITGRGGLLDPEARRLPGVDVRFWRTLKHPVRPCWDLVTWLRLIRFLRRERIDLVHTHSSKAGILGRLAAVCAGVPIILHTVHGWPFHEYQNSWVRAVYVFLERLAARFTTTLIAVSRATRDKGLEQRIGTEGQYTVIFPAVDLTSFSPARGQVRHSVRTEFGFPDDALLVGMVACLKPQKAPLDFVTTAASVAAAVPRARFLLVGDGRLRADVEAQIKDLGLQGRFVLTGWRRDVPRLMQAMDLLAHSALWEGLPCVFAQAQATGLPIVATDVGGAREAIRHGRDGLLVPPRQPAQMARALIALLRQPRRRQKLGQAAIRQAARFGFASMLSRLLSLYQELFAGVFPASPAGKK